MNVTIRTKDFNLLGIEALFCQIKPHLRKDTRLRRGLSNRTAGYFGEKNVDYMLKIYPQNSALALSNIRLKHKNFDFQLDSAIVTPQRHIILETKNWAGELEYDPDLRQLVQYHAGQKKRYICPIAQAETQKRNWSGWFIENGFPVLPIETFVVISNSSTILSNPQQDKHFSEKVFHVDLLHEKLDAFFSTNKVKSTPTHVKEHMVSSIQNQRFHRFDDILAKERISRDQLIRGIPCEKCWHHPVVRQARNWFCPNCNHTDKKAHVQTVYDYFLLNEMRPVTNRELRNFLNVPSRKITHTLLKNMQLKMTGTRRHAVYHAPPIEQFPQNSCLPSYN